MPCFPPDFKMFAVIQRGSTLAFCYMWEKQRMRSSNDLSEAEKNVFRLREKQEFTSSTSAQFRL